LAWFVRERTDFQYRSIVYLFAAFILACGATHLFSVLTLWVPVYGIEGLVKVLTAVLSLGTAFVLWPLVPRLLLLPSPNQLRDLNLELSARIAAQEASAVLLRESEARIRDINARLQHLATTDELTGLPNRRRLGEVAEREWRRCARDGTPLSVLMVDADHFKRFNDLYGHLAGDNCLRAIAAQIAAVGRRPEDLAARYGGEEFVLLLPDTSHAEARLLAERLCELLRDQRIIHQGNVGHGVVTLSVGAATARPGDTTDAFRHFDALLNAADAAVYRAKREGRNRVCSAMADEVWEGAQDAVT
jgi:diguanylate cyclase (GGDEF)-like protein